MLQIIETINTAVNNFIWGVPAMVCIFGVGLYLSIRTNFLQIRKFPYAIKTTRGRIFRKRDASDGAITPFQAVCTALAATVGTGNIAGVAGAIAIGGPGAIFWMWVSALFGMCTKYAEVTLAVHYREINANGELVGGPMYYIKNGLSKKWHWLAYLFAAFGVLTVFGTGNATQVNTITTAINSALLNYNVISESAVSTSNLIIGIIIAILIAMILLGGIKRIGHVTEKLVPIMALFYIIGCVIILVMNASAIPNAFVQIFTLAFQPQAIAGGVAGVTVQQAMRYGVARGLFSNEAGLGSTPHAHALAKVKQPQDQGALAIIGVFVDTFVILTLTALVLITSGLIPEGMTGTALTQAAFSLMFGSFGKVFIAICMLFFAFSTILGWYFFGQVNFNALFGSKYTKVYSLIVVLFILIGSSLKVDLVWALADFFNGLMAVPNLLALLALSGVVAGIARNKKD